MPPVTKTPDGGFQYVCECGKTVTLYVDPGETPGRLIKCFECLTKPEARYA